MAVGSVAFRCRKEPTVCPPASPKSRAAERQRLCPGVGPGTLSLPRRRVNTPVLGCPLHTRLYDDLVRPSQLLLLRGMWQLEGAEPITGPDPGAESAGAVVTVGSSPCPLPPSLVTVPSPVREEGRCHRDPSLNTERSADRVPRRGSLPSPPAPPPARAPGGWSASVPLGLLGRSGPSVGPDEVGHLSPQV